jgi:hypothetical protein
MGRPRKNSPENFAALVKAVLTFANAGDVGSNIAAALLNRPITKAQSAIPERRRAVWRLLTAAGWKPSPSPLKGFEDLDNRQTWLDQLLVQVGSSREKLVRHIDAGLAHDATRSETARQLRNARVDQKKAQQLLATTIAKLATEVGITTDQMYGFSDALWECDGFAFHLDGFIKVGLVNLPAESTAYARDERSGAVRVLDSPPPLGPYQDALHRLLRHPQFDARRLARCANPRCGAFFYKPRLASTCCRRSCTIAVKMQEYQDRERQRVEQVAALSAEGKSQVEMIATLGLKPGRHADAPRKRVRRYLAQVRRAMIEAHTIH